MRNFRIATSVAFVLELLCLTTNWQPVHAAPPVAVDDRRNGNEDAYITIDVLANDTDSDGDTLSIVQIEGMSIGNGTFVDIAEGRVRLVGSSLVFVPAENYFGPVSFSYTITDGTDESTASVALDVLPIDDIPVLSVNGPLGSASIVDPLFSELVFNTPTTTNVGMTEEADGIGNGEQMVFSNAGSVQGVPVSVTGTVIRNTTGEPVTYSATAGGFAVRLEANGTSTIRFEVTEAGTTTPIAGTFRLFVDDLDGFAIKDGLRVRRDELHSYIVDAATGLTITDEEILFVGANQGPSLRPEAAVELVYQDRSNFEIDFLHIPNPRQEGGRGIVVRGDFVSIFDTPEVVIVGEDFATTFEAGSSPVALTTMNAEGFDAEDNIAEITIETSGSLDGGSEFVSIAGEVFPLDSDSTETVMFNGVTYEIAYIGGVFTIRKQGGNADISSLELSELIESIRYGHDSADPSPGDRLFRFSVTDRTGLSGPAVTTTVTVIAPVCGDAMVSGIGIAKEECDDGNTIANDGCSADCKTEPDYICSGIPSVCVLICEDTVSAGRDEGCSEQLPHCQTNTSPRRCVECITSDDCQADQTFCGPENTCVPGCQTNQDCAATSATPVCDTAGEVCVACLNSSDCTDEQVCKETTKSCVQCNSPSDCPSGEQCNPANNMCEPNSTDRDLADFGYSGGSTAACRAGGRAPQSLTLLALLFFVMSQKKKRQTHR